MRFWTCSAGRGRVMVGALALLSWTATAQAQVASQGRGNLTLIVGQGTAPVGGIPSDVVDQGRVAPRSDLKHIGFRVVGGYQFADFLSFEAGVTHIGMFSSQAAYLGSDQVVAQTSFDAIEANLVGKFPFAPNARLDLTLGAVETGLNTSLSTALGSALPITQRDPVNVKHFGITVGADLEWRLTAHTSLIAGYHAYPDVGSSRIVGSANGMVSLIAGGLHFEF